MSFMPCAGVVPCVDRASCARPACREDDDFVVLQDAGDDRETVIRLKAARGGSRRTCGHAASYDTLHHTHAISYILAYYMLHYMHAISYISACSM